MTKNTVSRFWSLVAIGDRETCWPWKGLRNTAGYGKYFYGGRYHLAPRLAWQLAIGPILNDQCVCHTCDTPACVNLSHLWLGTRTDNNSDCLRKGRHHPMRGEGHGRAKLTEEQIREIRASTDSQPVTARRYGVTHVLVGKIRRGELWRHVA